MLSVCTGYIPRKRDNIPRKGQELLNSVTSMVFASPRGRRRIATDLAVLFKALGDPSGSG